MPSTCSLQHLPSRLNEHGNPAECSLISSRLLIHLDSSKHRHRLKRHLSRQRLIRLGQLRQQLEVVDIERRRGSEENPGLLIGRIAERMRRSNRHYHVVARFSVDDLFVVAWSVRIRDVEADHSLGDVEGLVVHFVPMGWRTWCSRWEGELCYADAVV